ncbi:RadC family protein [Citrobacter koseri]|uniref:RadC family protein n=1 Tax=Citrobacter koseri TaxID=545 RepID=UPI0023B05B2C|nr:DNA repair protein RadC [Citrobacter koseri]
MSQLSFSTLHTSLLVRDVQGHYLPATDEQILDAARQVIDVKMQRGSKFTSVESTREYLCAKLASYEHEVFAVLFLDSQHRLIEYAEMFHGSIVSTEVHPREIVKKALTNNSAAAILAHNHPSGNSEPSDADRRVTQRISDALELVEIRTLDHIIIGGNDTTSFAERGWL